MTHISMFYNTTKCIFQISAAAIQCKSPSFRSNMSQDVNKLFLSKTLQNRTIFYGSTLLSQDQNKTDGAESNTSKKLKQTGKLAKVFAEYGTTAVVFHTTISLTSLGISYMAVSR